MVIAHNMMAMNAQRQFNIVGNSKKKSTEKLSSGYRINRAADDSAGLAISEKMRRQIRGLTQASDNIQDGISLVQVADGALNETHEILQRINELSIKAANGTNTLSDREAIQDEIKELIVEVDRIANSTTFNEGIYPLNHESECSAGKEPILINLDSLSEGDYDGYSYHGKVGYGGYYIELSIDAPGDYLVSGGSIHDIINVKSDSNISFDNVILGYNRIGSGLLDGYSIKVSEGVDVAFNIKSSSDVFGIMLENNSSVTFTAEPNNHYNDLDIVEFISGDNVTINVDNVDLKGVKGFDSSISNPNITLNIYNNGQINGEINKKDYLVAGEHIWEGAPNNINIWSGEIFLTTHSTDAAHSFDIYPVNVLKGGIASKSDNNFLEIDYSVSNSSTHQGPFSKEDVKDYGPDEIWIQSGSEAGQGLTLHTVDARASKLGISKINVRSEKGAMKAIDQVKNAIEIVSSYRSYFGAMQNRMEHAMAIDDNIVENTQAAESLIRDTDMAKEMVELSKQNILEQVGQSMMAQANQSNQSVLSLLQ